MDDHQHAWEKYIQLVMVAYRSSVHAVTKYRPSNVVVRTPLRLPIDYLHERRHTEMFSTSSGFMFNTMREKQEEHQLVTAEMKVEKTRLTKTYDYVVMVLRRLKKSSFLFAFQLSEKQKQRNSK